MGKAKQSRGIVKRCVAMEKEDLVWRITDILLDAMFVAVLESI